MYYAESPKKTGVPREVLKWLQSLDLSFSPRNIRRDFSNGYLVAEVFSCYYPDGFQMHSFDNGTSLPTKMSNWTLIEKSLLKQNIRLAKDVIEGTIHCKPRAAEILIQEIYVLLTNRRIKTFQDGEADFTDRSYQEMLPMVARATASRAIKNNLRLSELIAEPSMDKNKQKVLSIIRMHLQQRQAERVENPERFSIKPSLGEQAVRLPAPPPSHQWGDQPSGSSGTSVMSPSTAGSTSSVRLKDVNVQELNTRPWWVITVQMDSDEVI